MIAATDQDGTAVVASGFLGLFGSQLATRLITFVFTLATARTLTPASYGLAAVQFHLLNTATLLLSREGLRRGCLRTDVGDPQATAKILGAASLSIPVGTCLTVLFVGGALLFIPQTERVMQRAVILQGAAAVLELLSEPLYILSMARMQFKLRMACETAATIVKNGSTLALLSFGVAPALAFSWAQIGYATVLLAGYSGHFVVLRRESIWSSAEAHQEGSSRLQFDPGMLRTCGVFAAQAAGKLLLAEGSKAVLAATTPLQEQGVYGLVTNLGSLVVRTIFQPFEEASFLAFTRPPAETGAAGLRKRASLLCLLCRAICSLGALAATFGPAYSHVALLLLYGSKWASTDAPDALAVYSLYVALLAANGILEAFVHAVAHESDLKRANIALACISVLHIGLSVAGVKMGGAVGLLLADGGNMVLRILYCLNFISAFFASTGGLSSRDLLPARTTLGALGTALAVTLVSQALFMPEESILARWSIAKAGMMPVLLMGDKIQRAVPSFAMRMAAHVGVGSVCLAGVCGVAWMEERKVILDVRRLKSKSE